jgi:hypothetical protein
MFVFGACRGSLIIRSWPRSNVSYSGVLRTIIHQELAAVIGTGLAEVIGTGFICGYILPLILVFEIRVYLCSSVAKLSC